MTMELLPTAVLATIMTKLDVASICSVAATCKTFNACASSILSFLPTFHLLDIAPSTNMLRPLLPLNPHLHSLKMDCTRLDDSSINLIIGPSLNELQLYNCGDFSGKLLSEIGVYCKGLRSLYLSSVADKRGRSIHISDLEELLSGCTELESLILMFDVSIFLRHNFARIWALASQKLTSLEIGFIRSVMVTELLTPNIGPQQLPTETRTPILSGICKLSLLVDYITDTMVTTIFKNLNLLTHLDLRDAPIIEPTFTFDLTNVGLQQINPCGQLKHLSLVRSNAYFKRVNDLGILLMADRCSNMESICLGGFCRVTDTGFKTILHSCSRLYKFKITHGTQLTDLVFHDIAATSLSLTYASLRWCNLLTKHAIIPLVTNINLSFLDLRDCRHLGDESLKAISSLPSLNTLLLDGSDITDLGLSYLKQGVISSLISLSVRGCKRLTDTCISLLFDGSSKLKLRKLDLSNLPNLSDDAVLFLAKSRVPFTELRIRQCPRIGDTSVMALASMLVDADWCRGSSLRLLDIYNCGRITQLSFRWLKKPYFPRLRWLGVAGIANRDMVDALARNRPFLRVACKGEELGSDQWDTPNKMCTHDYEEVNELEQWPLEDDNGSGDEEMVDAVNDAAEVAG